MKKGDIVYTKYGEAIVTYVCNVTKTCKVEHINYITPITDFYIRDLILK